MKISPPRIVSGKPSAAFAPASFRSAARPLLPSLLACALLGLALSASRAEETKDAGKDPVKPAAAKPAAKKRTRKAQDPPVAPDSKQSKDAQEPTKPAVQEAPPTPETPAPTAPAPGTVTITGLIDIYFGINFRAPSPPAVIADFGINFRAPSPPAVIATPSGETIKVDNYGHTFDINDREPSFSLGEVNIVRTQGRGFPLGVTATLTVGDTARIVHATEPGGTSSWQALQQLYVSRDVTFLRRPITIDFGKFVTPIGNEVIESVNNDNYTRGFVFQYAVPFYHAGLRATIPINSRLTLAAGVVNGWNNVADDNNAKTAFASLTYKPDTKFTGIINFIGGSEGTGAYGSAIGTSGDGNLTTNLVEFVPTYQIDPIFKIAGDIVYASAAGDVLGVHQSGNWLGLAAYGRAQITPRFAIAGRIEQFEDMPGAGTLGGAGLRLGTGGYAKLREGTITFEYNSFHGHLISRLEYRHDHAEKAFFGGGNGNLTPDQDTIFLGEAYKF